MLVGAFESLLRGELTDLEPYIEKINIEIPVKNSNAISHCYMLKFNGNDTPRVKDLAEFIAYKIVDYSIPRSEIEKAKKYDIDHNTTIGITKLQKKAVSLFTDIKNTGEGGEILLYVLTQTILRLPQVLCKMPLKTSATMHYHGVDGVHAYYDKEIDKLALYWGESKLYQNVNEAIKNCFESLGPYLCNTGGSASPIQRDLHLFRDNLDLLDETLENALLKFLDKDSPEYNKLEYRGVCLIGFDNKEYPTKPNSVSMNAIKAKIENEIEKWNEQLSTKLKDNTPLESFVIHIFLLPFPSVQEFRNAFLKELGLV